MAESLGPLGTAYVDVRASLKNLGADLGTAVQAKLSKTLNSVGKSLQGAGKTLSATITAPLLAGGGAAARAATQFDTSMRKITALVGVNRDQVNQWRDDLLKLAPAVGRAPQELAEGLFFVTSAGFRGAEAIKVLTDAAKASAAGLGSTETVADATTSAINAYGLANLSSAKATGILVAAVREGKASAESIAPVLGGIVPIASELGVGFDEVAASIAAMTRLGANAAEAGTALRAVLTGLLKPSSEGEETLAAMGTSAEELRARIADEGLLDVLLDLKERFGDNTAALATVFPNVRALSGVLNLVGSNADTAREIFASLAKETGGSLADAFAATAEGPGFKFQSAMASIQAALIRIGDAVLPVVVPMIQRFAGVVEDVVERFKALSPEMQLGIVLAAGLAAAVGPLLVVLGTVTVAAGGLVSMLGALSGAFAYVPLAVGVAIAALYGSGSLQEAFDLLPGDVRKSLDRLWSAVREVFEQRFGNLGPRVSELVAPIGEGFSWLAEEAERFFGNVYDSARTWLIDNFLGIERDTQNRLLEIAQFFSDLWSNVTDYLIKLYNSTVEWLVVKLEAVWTEVKAQLRQAIKFWSAFFGEMVDIAEDEGAKVGAAVSKHVGGAVRELVKGRDLLGGGGARPAGGPGGSGGAAAPGGLPGGAGLPGGLGADGGPLGGSYVPGQPPQLPPGPDGPAGAAAGTGLAGLRDTAKETLSYMEQLKQASFFRGFELAAEKAAGKLKTIGEAGAHVFDLLDEGVGDFAAAWATGTKSASEAWDDFKRSFLTSVVAMIAKQAALAVLTSFVSFGANVASGATAIPLISSIVAAAGSSTVTAAHGADFTVGGSGSIDSKLIAARVTPGETVHIRKPGQGGLAGGEMTVNLTVITDTDQEPDVAIDEDGIVVSLMRRVSQDIEEGGPVGRTIERTYKLGRSGRRPR